MVNAAYTGAPSVHPDLFRPDRGTATNQQGCSLLARVPACGIDIDGLIATPRPIPVDPSISRLTMPRAQLSM